jgi:hypothetical protein
MSATNSMNVQGASLLNKAPCFEDTEETEVTFSYSGNYM